MKLFHTILIPVDFTINTEVAICKALEIADADDTVIHLLHISKRSFSDVTLGRSSKTERDIDLEIKLSEWKDSIEDYSPGVKVICWMESFLSVEEGIIQKCSELSPDLIVVGKSSSHYLLPLLNTVVSSRIAKKTGCAVLTAKPGSLNRPLKHIVVPVSDELAEFKINFLIALCRRNPIKISLVTFLNDSNVPDDFSASSLLQAFQKLKTISTCHVEYAVLHGKNRGKAILQFAENKEADILLLEPYSETKIGWPEKHVSDLISSGSKVQVLAV